MSIVTNDRGSSHHNLLVNSHHSETATEQTIVTHSVPNAVVTEHPLVKKMMEKVIPLTQLMVTLGSGSMASAVVELAALESTTFATYPKIYFDKSFMRTSPPLKGD